MSLIPEIVVVSGLPRSGTSLMMQMLDRGGIPALTDQIRVADADNPRGYYEFERVKRTKQDPSWLGEARGKAVKLVSALLYDLPPTEAYRVIFMQRDIEEVLDSQEKMLRRLGRPAAPREKMKQSFAIHLERLFAWLPDQTHMQVCPVDFNALVRDAQTEVPKLAAFLANRASADQLFSAIDPALYRNRRAGTGPEGDPPVW